MIGVRPVRVSLGLGFAIAALTIAACSSSSSDTGGSDGSAGDGNAEGGAWSGDAAIDGGGDATVVYPDAAPVSDVTLDPFDDTTNFNDCTPYDFTTHDHTADADPRVITFDVDPTPQQYAPRCMKIRVGQTVTWKGGFAYHPLVPAGGDVPSPITADPMPGGSSRAITFPTAGMYGFECMTHEAPLEYGAIQVVP